MHFSSLTPALFALLSNSLVSAIPAELEARQQACSGDNCYRFFKGANILSASSFCISLLSSTPGTITVTGVAATATVTPTNTITSTINLLSTTTPGILCSTTVTASPVIINKRQAVNTFPSKASSACTSANKIAQTARLSSACRCVLTSATVTATPTQTKIGPAASVTLTVSTFTSTSTASPTCSAVTTSTVVPTCQNSNTLTKCDVSIGCHRLDYPPYSTSNNGGCIGCLKRGSGCDDGNTYCISGFRDRSPSCTYDSDCSNLVPYGYNIPLCMKYANGYSFCGSNDRNADGTGPEPGDVYYCVANPPRATRDLEWEQVVTSAKDKKGIVRAV